ncbi:hypothetical protein CEXT_222201 [Caerostris extrusa]|uniref:Uncharacterized protein n=1 Tax=Caerostris extrusa TaxID=172846 RepID=A0AAV4WFK1_CAEEX|nr:hypothetical protein CEXT_222201 [Caerostris extrusa]
MTTANKVCCHGDCGSPNWIRIAPNETPEQCAEELLGINMAMSLYQRRPFTALANTSSRHPQTIHAEQEQGKKWRMPPQFIKYGEKQRSGGIISGANEIIA